MNEFVYIIHIHTHTHTINTHTHAFTIQTHTHTLIHEETVVLTCNTQGLITKTQRFRHKLQQQVHTHVHPYCKYTQHVQTATVTNPKSNTQWSFRQLK